MEDALPDAIQSTGQPTAQPTAGLQTTATAIVHGGTLDMTTDAGRPTLSMPPDMASDQHSPPLSQEPQHPSPGSICACLQARMTARALTRMYDEALRPTGLKVTQLSLLAAIERGATGSISALADMLGLERTTLTRNLKLLGEQGLIAPRAGGGRAIAYILTDTGKHALVRATPLWRKAQNQVEAGMGQPAWGQARESLRALRRVARSGGCRDTGEHQAPTGGAQYPNPP